MIVIQIDASNIDKEHICCAIGNDKPSVARALSKKVWLKERFDEGLVFKRLNQRGKVFIEYMPVEVAWKPVVGSRFMLINCLWVSGQYKGHGFSTQLLNECIQDCKAQMMHGVAVVTSSRVRPFLTDKSFFVKMGFEVVDSAFPFFELLVLKWDPSADVPRFTNKAKQGFCSNARGFSFIYSSQCPFMEEFAQRFSDLSSKHGVACEVVKLMHFKEAQEHGSPFGTLGIFFNGRFQTHEVMTDGKCELFIREVSGCG